jgi:hypothetical protein
MKAKQILIYDDDCPFCKWYTAQFVRFQFLNESERMPYHRAIKDQSLSFDHIMASNKIALVIPENKIVKYGIDSLLCLLGTKIKWIETIGQLPILRHLLDILYALISYNRKLIAPNSCRVDGICVPSRSIFWRICFIVLIAIFVNFVTGLYFTAHLQTYYKGFKNIDFIFFGGQFIFQYLAFKVFKQKNYYDYAGNLAMVGLKGGLWLLFFHIGLQYLDVFHLEIKMLEPLCFGIVFAFMFIDHKVKVAQAWTTKLSYSWLCYRFIIYPIAFTL